MSQIAEPGTSITIKPDESWTCSCGKEQGSPGAWVAAHWYEELNRQPSELAALTMSTSQIAFQRWCA